MYGGRSRMTIAGTNTNRMHLRDEPSCRTALPERSRAERQGLWASQKKAWQFQP
jgi:hypothetical protein